MWSPSNAKWSGNRCGLEVCLNLARSNQRDRFLIGGTDEYQTPGIRKHGLLEVLSCVQRQPLEYQCTPSDPWPQLERPSSSALALDRLGTTVTCFANRGTEWKMVVFTNTWPLVAHHVEWHPLSSNSLVADTHSGC